MKKLFDLTIIGSGMIGSYSLLNIIKKYSNYDKNEKLEFLADGIRKTPSAKNKVSESKGSQQ